MRILVVGGGISNERAVSLRSSEAVARALKTQHDVELYDWDGTTNWLTQHAPDFDVVFPVLHGEGGEDGQIQSVLEELGCAYVGTDAEHSKLCIDKQQTRLKLTENGILVPEGALVDYQQYQAHNLFTRPHVLKSVTGGSSIDTFIFAHVVTRNLDQIQDAFNRHNTLLLEEYISGPEITVPILDGHDLPVIEIIPTEGAIFDYENKYNGATRELCPPRNISEELQVQAKAIASRCHQILGCRDLSRTDILIQDDTLYVLETNTLPGMTDQSLFPRAAAVAGLDMTALTDYLVQAAYKRKVN